MVGGQIWIQHPAATHTRFNAWAHGVATLAGPVVSGLLTPSSVGSCLPLTSLVLAPSLQSTPLHDRGCPLFASPQQLELPAAIAPTHQESLTDCHLQSLLHNLSVVLSYGYKLQIVVLAPI